jgi:hypothetical protein
MTIRIQHTLLPEIFRFRPRSIPGTEIGSGGGAGVAQTDESDGTVVVQDSYHLAFL